MPDVGPVIAGLAHEACKQVYDLVNHEIGVTADVVVIVSPHSSRKNGDGASIASSTVEQDDEGAVAATRETLETAYMTVLGRRPDFGGAR